MPNLPEADVNAPALEVPLVIGSDWKLSEQNPDAFTMVVFYRGLHCPMCKRYLGKLSGLLDGFAEKGFHVVAISMDEEERAKKTHSEWDLGDLPVGYGLSEEQAEAWGLYLSDSIKDSEPRRFCEPGLFWVRPDGRLYMAEVSNSPFARPELDVLLEKSDFVIGKDYPARGTKAA